MVMRFRCGGEPSARFHLGGTAAGPLVQPAASAVHAAGEAEPDRERTTWFMSSLELREGLVVNELSDDSIDRIVL